MKVLIIGAGAIAGYMAWKFKKAGADVTILARGERLKDLADGVLRLKDGYGGCVGCGDSSGEAGRSGASGSVMENTAEHVRVTIVDEGGLDRSVRYDLVLTAVRASQVESVLPLLKKVCEDAPVVYIGSWLPDAESSEPAACLPAGGRRVFYAFPGNAAVIDDEGIVEFVDRGGADEENWGITIGWLNPAAKNAKSEAVLARVEEYFSRAGLPPHRSEHMQSVYFSQLVVRLPILAALRLAGDSLDNLYVRGDLLKLMILGIRDSLGILKARGLQAVPQSLEMYRWIPAFVSANMMKHRFETVSSRIGIEEFGRCSLQETAFLCRRMLEIAEETDSPRGHLLYLFSVFDEAEEPG